MEETRNRRKVRQGRVVSNKMDRTIVVAIERDAHRNSAVRTTISLVFARLAERSGRDSSSPDPASSLPTCSSEVVTCGCFPS